MKKRSIEDDEVIVDVSNNVLDEPVAPSAIQEADAKPKRIRPSRAKPKEGDESRSALGKFSEATFDTASGEPSEASGEPSSASGEPSSASGEPSAASGEPSAASGKSSAASGEPSAASGKSSAASGKPSAASGKPSAASGKPSAASGKVATKKASVVSTKNGGSKDDSKTDTVILQLNIKKPVEGQTSNFEETFFKYEPNVDVPDAYDQLECNDYVSQPFDVTKVEEETVVPNYAINPPVKSKKKAVKAPVSKVNLDKKSNRIFDHLSEFIARDEWPMSTNNVCFWCCHTFHSTPFGVPTKYIDGKFHVFGCLCSLECTSAYNFYSTEIKHDPWEAYNLINLLARKIQYCDLVKMAPPRHALKMFGGYMEIDEFRSHCKSNKMINTHTFPMVAMIQQLEEVNEEDQYSNRKNMFIPVDKQKLFLLESKVKLERTKPLFMNKNTLDHTMNLRLADAPSAAIETA